jgi:hypothetical protein
MKAWSLARRELLKRLGLGAACLPVLRSGRARGAAAPRHLVIIQMTQGYRQASWRPAAGALQALPYTVEPFAPFRDDMIFLPGLSMPGVAISGAGSYALMFYGLSNTTAGIAYREPLGPTLDQLVGSVLSSTGGRRSLNLAVMLERPPQANPPPARKYCFWAGAGQPIRPAGDPYAIHRDLFAGGADTPEVKRLVLRRKSILDYVGTELQEYGKTVGRPEREVVEAHLQSVRELEAQVSSATAACTPAAPPSPPVDLNADASYPVILDLHLKAIVAALRCGVTNVATLQLSDAVATGVNLGSFIPGIPTTGPSNKTRTWHDLGSNPVFQGVDQKRVADRWFMERFAGFLQQLRDASLLDDSVVLIGNHMEDGIGGNNQRVPWMLAGKGGGWLNTGQCLPGEGRSIAGVMAGICEALGVTKHPYGDVLPGLKKI